MFKVYVYVCVSICAYVCLALMNKQIYLDVQSEKVP